MKGLRLIVIMILIGFALSSCGLWNKVFGPKYGCPSNGKNIGAEKLLTDPKAMKEAKKAKKFRS